VLRNVSDRVKAARDPLIQQSKGEISLLTSEIALNKARHLTETARKKLISLCGQDNIPYVLDVSDFSTLQPLPPFDVLMERSRQNPILCASIPK